MAGQRQKHPDALAYKGDGRYRPLEVVAATEVRKPPTLPKGTPTAVRRVWRDLWTSHLAGAFKPTDVPTLRRWAWWLGQWHRVAADVAEEELVNEGAHGQPTLNPKVRYLKQCESALRELEKAFGMDALARLRLGITLMDGQAKVAALKQPVTPEAM